MAVHVSAYSRTTPLNLESYFYGKTLKLFSFESSINNVFKNILMEPQTDINLKKQYSLFNKVVNLHNQIHKSYKGLDENGDAK